jgi:hypothetical protein
MQLIYSLAKTAQYRADILPSHMEVRHARLPIAGKHAAPVSGFDKAFTSIGAFFRIEAHRQPGFLSLPGKSPSVVA